jgi:hypothetical protein
MFVAAERFGAVQEPIRTSVPQQAEELLGGIANGADIRRHFPLVDIPADDAFPPLRHRGKLYQTAAGPGGKCSKGALHRRRSPNRNLSDGIQREMKLFDGKIDPSGDRLPLSGVDGRRLGAFTLVLCDVKGLRRSGWREFSLCLKDLRGTLLRQPVLRGIYSRGGKDGARGWMDIDTIREENR